MTKSILGFLVVMLTAGTAYSQQESKQSSTWKVHSFGVNFGTIHDVYQRMNLDMMYDFTQNPTLLDRDLNGLQENLYRESSGARIGLNVSLLSSRKIWAHELRLGAFYSNREPMISYNDEITIDNLEGQRIIYCNVVNEVSADAAYLLRRSIDKNGWLTAYAGLGATLGSSFNNKMVVMESVQDSTSAHVSLNNSYYDGKSSLFTRMNVPVGVEITILEKVNINVEANLGIAMQTVFGGRSYFIPLSTGVRLGLSYNL